MIKRIITFTATIVLLFFIVYYGQQYYIESNNLQTTISIEKVCVFYLISSFIIYSTTEGILRILPSQTGFLFLALTLIKMGLFLLLFQKEIFTDNKLQTVDKSILVIPFLTYLLTETIAIGLLLNRQNK